MYYEFRTNNAYDSILKVEDDGEVIGRWEVTSAGNHRGDELGAFLTDLESVDYNITPDSGKPDDYGELVMKRWEDGEVDEETVDWKKFAERLAFWFRG